MKNKLTVLLGLLFFSLSLNAQTDTAQVKPEKFPAFKGGANAWVSFVQANVDINLMDKNNAPAGKHQVIASFIVDTDGSVLDIKIEKDPGYGAADEMIRLMKKSSKKWEPAIYQGKPIGFRTKQSLTLNQ